ncbi:hypothetical protein EDB89DRAFT_1910777 [Lactarius sanguifluus]|nr:hypothetical protein EDB89DRAFT_1910777 [Lactarius sanguifluus]
MLEDTGGGAAHSRGQPPDLIWEWSSQWGWLVIQCSVVAAQSWCFSISGNKIQKNKKLFMELGLPRSGAVRFRDPFFRTLNRTQVRFGLSHRTSNLYEVQSGSEYDEGNEKTTSSTFCDMPRLLRSRWVVRRDRRVEGVATGHAKVRLAPWLIILAEQLGVFLFELADAQGRWWQRGDLFWRVREHGFGAWSRSARAAQRHELEAEFAAGWSVEVDSCGHGAYFCDCVGVKGPVIEVCQMIWSRWSVPVSCGRGAYCHGCVAVKWPAMKNKTHVFFSGERARTPDGNVLVAVVMKEQTCREVVRGTLTWLPSTGELVKAGREKASHDWINPSQQHATSFFRTALSCNDGPFMDDWTLSTTMMKTKLPRKMWSAWALNHTNGSVAHNSIPDTAAQWFSTWDLDGADAPLQRRPQSRRRRSRILFRSRLPPLFLHYWGTPQRKMEPPTMKTI